MHRSHDTDVVTGHLSSKVYTPSACFSSPANYTIADNYPLTIGLVLGCGVRVKSYS